MPNRILLELTSRRRIYDHIRNVPGIHMRRLERELNIPLSTLDYHLRQMERKGLVLARKEGQKKSYFVRNTMEPKDQHYLYYLRHRTTRWILLDILENPGTSLRGLTQRLPVGAPTISYHLKKLIRAEIVQPVWIGRHRRYQVVESERLHRLIEAWRGTFRRQPTPAMTQEAKVPAQAPEEAQVINWLFAESDQSPANSR